jgi:hypothetical protein
MMNETNKSSSDLALDDADAPNEALAKRVIAELVECDLISRTDGERWQSALAAGKLDGSSWKLMFENRIERGESGDERK